MVDLPPQVAQYWQSQKPISVLNTNNFVKTRSGELRVCAFGSTLRFKKNYIQDNLSANSLPFYTNGHTFGTVFSTAPLIASIRRRRRRSQVRSESSSACTFGSAWWLCPEVAWLPPCGSSVCWRKQTVPSICFHSYLIRFHQIIRSRTTADATTINYRRAHANRSFNWTALIEAALASNTPAVLLFCSSVTRRGDQHFGVKPPTPSTTTAAALSTKDNQKVTVLQQKK